jgi:HEAT repeat protein
LLQSSLQEVCSEELAVHVVRKSADSLIADLGSADSRERENAANALIAMRDPRAEEPLLGALDDREAGVRGQAALAIGSLGCRRAVPRLLELTRDPNWFVRVAALNGLGYIDPTFPAEPALAALGDDEPLVRQAAALNMGDSRDPVAVDLLVEALLHDPDWAVREAAAEALGEIGDPRAADALRRAGSLWRVVGSWRVVRAARRALHRIETAER